MPFLKMMRPEVRDMWAYYQAGFQKPRRCRRQSRYVREPVRTALVFSERGSSVSPSA